MCDKPKGFCAVKIYPSIQFLNIQQPKEQPQTRTNSNHKADYATANTLLPQFNDYLLAFTARVDKGLERFYDTNKDKMPQTVRTYVENLEDKSKITPLEAQKNAYELLEISQTIEDIKSAYPDEPLFADLINPNQSKAKRGLLNSVKENEELLALGNQGVLKDKSNLTVYLVKKIFLEDKTIEEINQDLEKDLDEDFKADFKFKNPDSPYVYGSTLASLGIKTPNAEYRQSLRYTRDGYSDAVGDKISESQRAFWDSLSLEERTVRNKKSVEQFENWWSSMTRNQILEMIADQTTELEMLKAFKKFRRDTEKTTSTSEQKNKVDGEENTEKPRKHNRIGSNKLKQDELFIKWASNNLKIYMANLTEAEKDSLHIKRMQRLSSRWAKMTPAERTDYISKMKSGSEPLRYTMIDAWNHSSDLIKDLSLHLKQNQIYKPADLLYSSTEFSEFQSRVMTEFWENHPDHAEKLGANIIKSQQKIQSAIQNGTFEELKKQIMRDKNQRIKEMEKFKQSITVDKNAAQTEEIPEYFKEFKNAYYHAVGAQLKNLPQKYVTDYFRAIQNGYTQAELEAWTRNLNGEPQQAGDRELLEHIRTSEPEDGQKINRALEAAGADTLYACTRNPEVYLFSHSDVKVALQQIARGEPVIKIGSHKLDRMFEMPLIKNRIDSTRINMLYSQYMESLDNKSLDNIIDTFFVVRDDNLDTKIELSKYLNTYGKSLNIIFSDKSAYSKEIKAAMYEKLMTNMPSKLYNDVYSVFSNTEDPFKREEEIKHVKYAFSKRYDFVPALYMNDYMNELGKKFRSPKESISTDEFIKLCCQKRKDPKARGKIAILQKNEFSMSNRMRTLAMEEALADALYEATGNIDVYTLSFEELCENIELFNLVKKFPSEKRTFISQTTGKEMELTAGKKINLNNLQKNYLEYINEIVDWINEDVKASGYGKAEDLLYILNPDENMPEKDAAVMERIKLYGLNLQ